MEFSELKVGDRIRQRSWEDSWKFWSFPGVSTEETLNDYVGDLGFGTVEAVVVKIEYDFKDNETNKVYPHLITILPAMKYVVGGDTYFVNQMCSCRHCEKAPVQDLGGCGNPCWNCLMEKVT